VSLCSRSSIRWHCQFVVLAAGASLSLTRRVANCVQDILDIVFDVGQLHRQLLHRGGGGCGFGWRGGRYGDVVIEFLHQGVHSSLEQCCFFPGGEVGFAQRCVLGLGRIHLLEQAVHLAVEHIKV
jgi:hypothetical protein